MAQLNARVADEDKEKAEKIVKSFGLSLTGYVASIIEYIADSGTIPFEVRRLLKKVNLDDSYAEAVHKFEDLYHGLLALKNAMKPGIEDQMARSQSLRNDHSLVVGFLKANQRYVYNAPCQIDKIGGSEGREFSLSREKFAVLDTYLSGALACTYDNSRPLAQFDLDEMTDLLSSAEEVIQSLLAMCPAGSSEESRVASFLAAADDMARSARALTDGPYDPHVFPARLSRLDAGSRDVQANRRRIGKSRWDRDIFELSEHLVELRRSIHRWNEERLGYATRNNYQWLAFDASDIEIAEGMVRALQRRIDRAAAR